MHFLNEWHCQTINQRIERLAENLHFNSYKGFEITLDQYAWPYNQELCQSVLGSKPPLQSIKD